MKEIASIKFVDAASDDEAVAIVRAAEGLVAVTLSLRRGSDVEVLLRTEDGRLFLAALQRAISVAETSDREGAG
jgi:hypothetical protein